MSPPDTRSSSTGAPADPEQLELVGDRERDALEDRPGQGGPPVAQRQAGEGAPQVRVGPLAVAEDRQGDDAVRPGGTAAASASSRA